MQENNASLQQQSIQIEIPTRQQPNITTSTITSSDHEPQQKTDALPWWHYFLAGNLPSKYHINPSIFNLLCNNKSITSFNSKNR